MSPMTTGVVVLIVIAVVVAGVLALDWTGARRQRRRLSSGEVDGGRRHPLGGRARVRDGGYGSVSGSAPAQSSHDFTGGTFG